MPSPGPTIDSDLLAAFAVFAETLNFTSAARRVGLSQPALFERISRLQSLLDVPLYRRAGRALELTPQGVKVAAHARECAARDAAFLGELRGQPATDTVSLAAGEGSYLYLLGPALRRFSAEEPAQLRLLTLGARDACLAVLSGEAHLAVCALDIVPEDLLVEDLARTPICLAMPRGHRLARRREVALAELGGERLILTPAGQLHRDLVGRALGRAGQPVADPIEADGWPLMLRFTQLGLGVAFVNGICALPQGVVARPVPELGSITYRLLRRRGARLPGAAERLAGWIRELAQGQEEDPG
jgi:DNA-binding transcriptional LysR family regulator